MNVRVVAAWLFMIGSCLFADLSILAPASGQELEYVSSTLWSGAHGVRAVGGFAYCGYTNGLIVFDISDPEAPAAVSRVYCEGGAGALDLLGDTAILRDYNWGFRLIDVADPLHPTALGAFETPGQVFDLDARGKFVYVADGWTGGLQIVDISNPYQPEAVGSYNTFGQATAVSVAGNIAYVADGVDGVVFIDVTDPGRPTYAGGFYQTYGTFDILAYGDYVYVLDTEGQAVSEHRCGASRKLGVEERKTARSQLGAADHGPLDSPPANRRASREALPRPDGRTSGGRQYDYCRLLILDATNPVAPVLLGVYDDFDGPQCVTVVGSYAYVAEASDRMQIIDISNPHAPTRVAALYVESGAYDIDVVAGLAHLASASSGFQIVDVHDPLAPAMLGSWCEGRVIRDAETRNGYAYVADMWFGVRVVDITNPCAPIVVAGIATLDLPGDLLVTDDLLFVADADSGLEIYDICDPVNPQLLARTDRPALGVSLVGDYAYVGGDEEGLWIFDVSDPSHPVTIGSCPLPGNAAHVCVAGHLAYVAARGAALQIVDISDPEHPTLCGEYDDGDYLRQVVVTGNHAFLPCGQDGLKIVDVADPEHPVLAGTLNTSGYPRGVYLTSDYLFVSGGCVGGPLILDVTDPVSPVILTGYETPSASWNCFLDGGELYVADNASLMVLGCALAGVDNEDPARPGVDRGAEEVNAPLLDILFPNPVAAARGLLDVTVTALLDEESRAVATATLFDALGRCRSRALCRLTGGFHRPHTLTLTWNSGALPSGTYFCRIRAGEQQSTRRVSIVR